MPGGTPDEIRNTGQAGQPRLNGKLRAREEINSDCYGVSSGRIV